MYNFFYQSRIKVILKLYLFEYSINNELRIKNPFNCYNPIKKFIELQKSSGFLKGGCKKVAVPLRPYPHPPLSLMAVGIFSTNKKINILMGSVLPSPPSLKDTGIQKITFFAASLIRNDENEWKCKSVVFNI